MVETGKVKTLEIKLADPLILLLILLDFIHYNEFNYVIKSEHSPPNNKKYKCRAKWYQYFIANKA